MSVDLKNRGFPAVKWSGAIGHIMMLTLNLTLESLASPPLSNPIHPNATPVSSASSSCFPDGFLKSMIVDGYFACAWHSCSLTALSLLLLAVVATPKYARAISNPDWCCEDEVCVRGCKDTYISFKYLSFILSK